MTAFRAVAIESTGARMRVTVADMAEPVPARRQVRAAFLSADLWARWKAAGDAPARLARWLDHRGFTRP